MTGGGFVRKGNKDPAGSIKLLHNLFTPADQKRSLWGRQGIDWHWSPDHHSPVFNFNYSSTNEPVKRGTEY